MSALVITERRMDKSVGYDIFLIAGQSNNLYGIPNTADTIPDVAGLDAPDSDIKQLGRFSPNANVVIEASEPLEHNDSDRLGRAAYPLTFAKWYKANHLQGSRKILLVPCAVGGSSFSGDDWNPDDPLYDDLVARANTAKSIGTGYNIVRGLLWHQGESDTVNLTGAQYKTAWKTMVSSLETDISEPNLVVVVGGLSPFVVNIPNVGYVAINTALSELPSERSYTGFADPASPTELLNESGGDSDNVHFSVRQMRGYPTHDFSDVSTLGLAGRYATAYLSALANK